MSPVAPALVVTLAIGVLSSDCHPRNEPALPDPLVAVAPRVQGLVEDLRYATDRNFLGRRVYADARCYLRKPVAERLARVGRRLGGEGLRLRAWDCYRALSVQRQMWTLVPDARYVADPREGSKHNRGAAVDLTLAESSGAEIAMPTGFDDFRPAAWADAPAPEPARTNRARLRDAMTAEGFLPIPHEWWHFDDPDWRRYPVLDIVPGPTNRASRPTD